MLLNVLNIAYLLVTIAMVAFILLQRGPGATAGSGLGAGASATVFGARGSANFLSRSTSVLAVMFFALSLAMAVYVSRGAIPAAGDDLDLGVMGGVNTAAPAADDGAALEPAPASESIVIGESADGSATVSQTLAPAAAEGAETTENAASVPEAAADAPQEDASGQ